MLKKTFVALSIMALSGTALSAPIANLKIQGSITPPTCAIQGETEVDVLYKFDITPGLFPVSGNLRLTPQTKNIQVVCDAVTYLAFTAVDDRVGTEMTIGNNNFGLGEHDMNGTNTKIGYYTVTMKNATTQQSSDSAVVNVGVRIGTTHATTGLLNKEQSTAWSISSTALASAQVFSADFEVKPTINSAMKNSDDDAELDGHAILAFKFGL